MADSSKTINLLLNQSEAFNNVRRIYEIPPYAESSIKSDINVDLMIIQITESIIEQVTDKAKINDLDSQCAHFLMHCFKEAWSRVMNWYTFSQTKDGMSSEWIADFEPDFSPLDPYCSSVIPKREKEQESCACTDKICEEVASDEFAVTGTIEMETVQIQQKTKRKKIKKKKVIITEEEKERIPSLRLSHKSNNRTTQARSVATKSFTSSIGFGDYKESGKRKYVKQLAKFINPKTFQKQWARGGMRVHAPDTRKTLESTYKGYKMVVINVKEMLPDLK